MSAHNYQDGVKDVHGAKDLKLYGSKDANVKYAAEHSLRLHPAQTGLIQETLKHPEAIMLGSADQLNLLQLLCKALGAKKTLDIGVYTGYSALTIALILPEDGKLIGCDVSEDFVKIGRPFWKQAGVDHKIDFREGPALETLQKLVDNGESGTFDFAFIDADKPNYTHYYELCLKLLRKGGVVAMDNVLWGGLVCDPNTDDYKAKCLRELAEKVHKDDRVHCSMIAVGDGTLMAVKN